MQALEREAPVRARIEALNPDDLAAVTALLSRDARAR